MKIIFVVGLPASGKTHYVQSIKNALDMFIDDPSDITNVFNICDEAKAKKVNVYIADPKLCVCNILRSAVDMVKERYTDAELEFVYFDNNPIQCQINASLRLQEEPGKKVSNFINQLSSVYKPNSVYRGNVIAVYS